MGGKAFHNSPSAPPPEVYLYEVQILFLKMIIQVTLRGFDAQTIELFGSWNNYSPCYPLVKNENSTEHIWRGSFPIALQPGIYWCCVRIPGIELCDSSDKIAVSY